MDSCRGGGGPSWVRDDRQLASSRRGGDGGGSLPAASSSGYEPAGNAGVGFVDAGNHAGGYGGGDGGDGGRRVTPYQTRGGWVSDVDSHQRSSGVAVLTSTPLTSYVPPLSGDRGVVGTTALDDAYMDLSVLPYNPQLEVPVVWDVFLSDGGSTVESVFGDCLKMVQCTGRGAEILSRERELAGVGSTDVVGGSGTLGRGRSLMTLVPMTSDPLPQTVASHVEMAASAADDPGIAPAFFDPPLRTEVLYTSTYVNVDCATPLGVDRGVAHRLAESGMSDVFHSPHVHDAARLFSMSSSPTASVKVYGRAVVVLRDPIEMSVAKYERMRVVDVNVGGMSLEEFAKSGEFVLRPPLETGRYLVIYLTFCFLTFGTPLRRLPRGQYLHEDIGEQE